MTTLYRKDKDRIRILEIYTEGADLVQRSGLIDGALVENRKTCKGKNIGRSNETTPEQQALSEMESKIAEKLKTDYFRTQKEAETTTVVLPMLAKSYDDHSHKIDWENAYEQPKLDGMRAFGKTGPAATLTSREGSPIETMPHIIDALRFLPEGHILDGELYAHGLSFQENMTLIKKNRGEESEQIRFHVYDSVSDQSFDIRFARIARLISVIANTVVLMRFNVVDTFKVSSQAHMQKRHEENLANGFEGTIVRWGNAPYKLNARSENLLKYKEFKDVALPILDIIPSDARPEWGQAIYKWPGATGHPMGDDILGSGMKLSHEERKEWLRNKQDYIGKTAEVRYFELSDTGVPRFPVTVGIRLDK